jgi:hypothetical protein
MPYRFEFEFTHHVLCCIFKGRVTDKDLRQFHRDAARVVQRTDPHAAIVNFSGVKAFDVSGGAMRSMARSDPLMQDATRPRFIVAPADLTFGMSRMYQLLSAIARPELHVVHTRQEAFSAIGLVDPDFRKIPAEVSGMPEE